MATRRALLFGHSLRQSWGRSNPLTAARWTSGLGVSNVRPLKIRPPRKKTRTDHSPPDVSVLCPSDASLAASSPQSCFLAVAYSTAEEYDMLAIREALDAQGLYRRNELAEDVDGVLCAAAKYEVEREQRDFFVFKEGSIVFWNFPEVERKAVLHLLKPHEDGSYDCALVQQEAEVLEYSRNGNRARFVNGRVFLPSEGRAELEKYTFSNGMALSVKLAIWEASLDAYVDGIENLVEDMKRGRKIRMTREQLFRKTGELFSLRHLINLGSDLLDTPDFYWDRQNLENLYLKVVRFLNVERRTKVMNEKLSHCCELMDLLNHRLEDEHHVRLELMIILLIAVEVGFECLHYAARSL